MDLPDDACLLLLVEASKVDMIGATMDGQCAIHTSSAMAAVVGISLPKSLIAVSSAGRQMASLGSSAEYNGDGRFLAPQNLQ